MEKILYEYHINLPDYLGALIPLIVGIVFLINSILIIKSKGKGTGWDGLISSFFKISGFIVAPLGLFLSLWTMIDLSAQHLKYKEMLAYNEVLVVEGYVENFHPMPYEGHDTEHFEIDGVYFEYTDYDTANGYHRSASHGGVVTQNGQHLKIKYITEEYEYEGEKFEANIILYIAEIE